MKKFKRLLHNNDGFTEVIITAVVLAITFAIAIIIVFNIVSSVDMSTVDTTLETALNPNINETAGHNMTFGGNATSELVTNLETFFTVGPIALIIVAAIGILTYILLLRRR